MFLQRAGPNEPLMCPCGQSFRRRRDALGHYKAIHSVPHAVEPGLSVPSMATVASSSVANRTPPPLEEVRLEISAELEPIEGLSPLGIFFHWPGGVCICVNCKFAVRQTHIVGHLVKHPEHTKRMAPKRDWVSRMLRGLPLLDEQEEVPLPSGTLAPFPFLELHRDAQGHPLGRHCSLCDFCCLTEETMRHHVNDPSMHDERQRNRAVYTAGQLSTKGYVQRFFVSGEGSSYFRVDPLLSGVQKGGDFDLFLNSVRSSQGGDDMPYDGSRHDVPSEPWDVSPYLARTGWPEHLKGYSWGSMIKAVGKLRTDDPIFLNKLPDLAHSYFKSLSSTDVMRFVHPANLDQLSHWKRYAILTTVGAPNRTDLRPFLFLHS